MNYGRFSRRIFLKISLASLFLAGCRPDPTPTPGVAYQPATATPGDAATAAIPPTATPPPAADYVVQAYLQAWQNEDLDAMYDLLNTLSRQRITRNQFVSLHQHALNEATVQQLTPQVKSLLVDPASATALFGTQWQTTLFDPFSVDQTMRLTYQNGVWGVEWQPDLLLPQLNNGASVAFIEETTERGDILDYRNGLLATNQDVVTIGVIPLFVTDPVAVANTLSPLVELEPQIISEKIAAGQPNWFVALGDVDFETNVRHHQTLESLAGVERRVHPERLYPQTQTAGHIIGTLGPITAETFDSYRRSGYRGDEMVGQTGIEAWGEPFLAGRRGGDLVTLNATGNRQETIAGAKVVPGGNIFLQIDTDLQQQAEYLLGNRRGAIVVMEPDGVTRAMASYPRFDPNDFATGVDVPTWTGLLNDPDRPLVNRATQGIYPPASTFKIVTTAAALENGYNPTDSFTCGGTWYGLGEDFPKKCWLERGHGSIDIFNGLVQSCDVVFYEIGLALHKEDPNILPDMARRFGFGDPTGMLGLNEAGGVIPTNDWKMATLGEPFFDGDAVNTAIGQGYMLATPLQVAQMMCAVGNYGRLMRPQIIRQLSSQDSGDQVFVPETVRQIELAQSTWDSIQDALYEVAFGPRGTAREAFEGVGYSLCGKTGTAETGIDEPHAWFTGYAPATNPQVIITVLLENAGEGSEMAAPLFRLMADAYFDWKQ